MQKEETSCTIILGVQRSGVSVLGGVLQLLGANLGRSCINDQNGDATDAFVNQDIVVAHDILLRNLGRRWDMVGVMPDNWQKSEAAKQCQATLTEIIKTQYLGKGPFVLNDHRLCRLMPLWIPLLKKLSIPTTIIFLLRHPLEVAFSMQQHDGFDLLKGHLLWMSAYREAFVACKSEHYSIVTFDQLIYDTLTTIRNVVDTTHLKQINDQDYSSVFDFISPELKKHYQDNATDDQRQQFIQYSWIYDQLRLKMAATNTLDVHDAECNKTDQGSSLYELSSLSLPIPGLQEHRNVLPVDIYTAKIFTDLLNSVGKLEEAARNHLIEKNRRILAVTDLADTLYMEVVVPGGSFSTGQSHKILLAPGEWQEISIDILQPEILRTKRLRLDPLNTYGVAVISTIKLTDYTTGDIYWTAQNNFSQCTMEHGGFILSAQDTLVIACTGNDPQLFLPLLADLPDRPLRLNIWIKVCRDQDAISEYIAKSKKTLDGLKSDLHKSQEITAQLETEKNALTSLLEGSKRELQKSQEAAAKFVMEIDSLTSSMDGLQHELQQHQEAAISASVRSQRTLQQNKEAAARFEADKNALASALERTKRELNQRQEAVAKFEAEKKSLTSALEQSKHELQQRQEAAAKFEAEKNTLATAFEGSKRDLQQRQDAATKLEAEKKSLTNALEVSKRELQLSQEAAAGFETEKKLFESRYLDQKSLTREYFTSLAGAEEKLEQLNITLKESQEAATKLEAEKNALANELERSKDELQQGQEAVSRLETEKISLGSALERSKRELRQSQEAAARFEADKNALAGAVERSKRELQQGQEAASRLEAEKKVIESKYLNQKSLTKEYFTSLAGAEEKLEQLNITLKESQEAATRLKAEKNSLASALERSRRELQHIQEAASRRNSETEKRIKVVLGVVYKLLKRMDSKKLRNKLKDSVDYLKKSGLFDVEYYKTRYPDVAESGIDPVLHYVIYGWAEFRWPNEYFDTYYYLSNYDELMSPGLNPLVDFDKVGWKEGRNPSKEFNVKNYLKHNPDVATADINPLRHYLQMGKAEGRRL